MDKWKQFGSYERWKAKNQAWLQVKFDSDKEIISNMIEPPDFDDYCLGVWQRMD